MRKFLVFAAMASVALASCVSEDNEDFAQDSRRLISFDAPVLGTQTKGAVNGEISGTTYPTTEMFVVYARQHAKGQFGATAGWNTNSTAFWNDGQVISYGSSIWSTSTPYYWPATTFDLTFSAFSPSDVKGATYGATGLTVANFNVGATPHTDLMYSGRIPNRNESNSSSGVPVVFKHALASIIFNAIDNNDNANYVINSFNITGTFANSGTFNEGYADDKASELNAKWTLGTATTTTYTPNVTNKSLSTTTGATTTLTTGETAILPIPQALPADAKVVVNYTVTPTTGSEYSATAEIPMSEFKKTDDSKITTWNISTRYTYVISFGGSNRITFLPEVSDWTDGGVARYTIK